MGGADGSDASAALRDVWVLLCTEGGDGWTRAWFSGKVHPRQRGLAAALNKHLQLPPWFLFGSTEQHCSLLHAAFVSTRLHKFRFLPGPSSFSLPAHFSHLVDLFAHGGSVDDFALRCQG